MHRRTPMLGAATQCSRLLQAPPCILYLASARGPAWMLPSAVWKSKANKYFHKSLLYENLYKTFCHETFQSYRMQNLRMFSLWSVYGTPVWLLYESGQREVALGKFTLMVQWNLSIVATLRTSLNRPLQPGYIVPTVTHIPSLYKNATSL